MQWKRRSTDLALGAVLVVAALATPACSVQQDKSGGKDNVKISTPIGGLQVNNEPDLRELGLSLYPGSKLKPHKEHDDSSANVNINTPFFGLKVVVAKYTSDDAPDKVAAFYKNELAKYGSVLECNSNQKAGDISIHTHQDNGKVTCDKDVHGDTLELKVGSEQNQRVVAITPSGKGTEFALVYVNAHAEEKRETM